MEESEKRAFCPECERQFDVGQRYCPHDGALLLTYDVVDVARDDPMLGEVLDDRFRIEEPLSEGGMGKVYLGSQMGVDRRVAIKVLNADPSDGERPVRRFLREAHTLSNFSHPNIVNFIDFGQDPERDALYLVMELIEGCDLGQLLTNGRLRVDFAVEIMLQLCAALTEPHEHGFVHRDLKPANVMLLPLSDGSLQVKLVDFGIADAVDGGTKVTKTGAVIGTPNYMAPEQAENSDVTPSSDIYSVGALLFHMLSGQPMFEARSDLQLIFKHVQEEPPPLESLPNHRNFPVGLFGLFRRLVSKSPEERPDSILEVRQTLLEIVRNSDIGGIDLDPSLPIEEALEPWILPGKPDLEEDIGELPTRRAESEAAAPSTAPEEAATPAPGSAPPEEDGSDFDERTHVGFGPTVLNEEGDDDASSASERSEIPNKPAGVAAEDPESFESEMGSTEVEVGETKTGPEQAIETEEDEDAPNFTAEIRTDESSGDDEPSASASPEATARPSDADDQPTRDAHPLAVAVVAFVLFGSGAFALWLALTDERPAWLEPTAHSSSVASADASDGGRARRGGSDTGTRGTKVTATQQIEETTRPADAEPSSRDASTDLDEDEVDDVRPDSGSQPSTATREHRSGGRAPDDAPEIHSNESALGSGAPESPPESPPEGAARDDEPAPEETSNAPESTTRNSDEAPEEPSSADESSPEPSERSDSAPENESSDATSGSSIDEVIRPVPAANSENDGGSQHIETDGGS